MTFTCSLCGALANEDFPAPPDDPDIVVVFVCWRCRDKMIEREDED